MGKHVEYYNGFRYTDKSGQEFEIVNYVGSKKVQVKNLATGELSWTKNEIIQAKRGSGSEYKPKTKRNPSPVVGQRFETENHGWATIIAINGYKMDIVFDNTGAIRTDVYRAVTYSGKVSDPSVGRIQLKRFYDLFKVGAIFDTKRFGKIEIVEVVNSVGITIKWLDTGRIATGLSSGSILSGDLVDKVRKDDSWNYLNVNSEKYYVYCAKQDNEIVYIGKGIGRRYLHINSGRSHNVQLNRLFFCEGNPLVTEILLGGIETDEQATRLEKEFILEFNPIYNSKICKSEY